MASTDVTPQPNRELAHRANDGVEVVLSWHQVSNELTVSVSDQRTGAHFELEAEQVNALDVFHHPYAYAAFRGLPKRRSLPKRCVARGLRKPCRNGAVGDLR